MLRWGFQDVGQFPALLGGPWERQWDWIELYQETLKQDLLNFLVGGYAGARTSTPLRQTLL